MKTPLSRVTFLALLAGLALPAALAAQQPEQGKMPKEAKAYPQMDEVTKKKWETAHAAIPQDEKIISEYLKTVDQTKLPPGLAKREALPPGIEKQILDEGKLPVGFDQQIKPLPPELDSKLGAIDPKLKRGFAGDRVVEWDPASGNVWRVLRIST